MSVILVTPFCVVVAPTDEDPEVEDNVYLYVVLVMGVRYWKVCWLPSFHHIDNGRLDLV
jgi:hypothetical protein